MSTFSMELRYQPIMRSLLLFISPLQSTVSFANWLASHYRLFLAVYLPYIEHFQCTCKFACKPSLLFFLFDVFLDIICNLQKTLSMQIRYQPIMSNILLFIFSSHSTFSMQIRYWGILSYVLLFICPLQKTFPM